MIILCMVRLSKDSKSPQEMVPVGLMPPAGAVNILIFKKKGVGKKWVLLIESFIVV